MAKWNNVWGLKNVVESTNPKALQKYEWLLQDLVPKRTTLDKVEGYSIQVLSALIGPCVFDSTIYEDTPYVIVRQEFLVKGPQLPQAIKCFINTMLNDVTALEKSRHYLIGVGLPVREKKGADWKVITWNVERISKEKELFWKFITAAISANRMITAQCVFCIDAELGVYRLGEKQYGLNVLRIFVDTERKEIEELHYFTEYALSTLYEGIFMSQTHAEAYVSIFTSRLDIVDKSDVTSAVEGDKQDKKEYIIGDKFGPDSWQITAPIKSNLQKGLVRMEGQGELYHMSHNVLQLALMDRDDYKDLITDVYKYHRSTGAKLYRIVQRLDTMHKLVQKMPANKKSKKLVKSIGLEIIQNIEYLLDNNLSEKSSDLVVTSKVITSRVRQILDMEESTGLEFHSDTSRAIKNLISYSNSLLMLLTDDAVGNSTGMLKFIKTLRDAFPDEISRPKTPLRDRTKGRTGARAGEGNQLYVHGNEDKTLRKHDDQVINVPMCIEQDSAPKLVATESVLLKYVLDTHLDEVWTNFVLELVAGVSLPPNPYPRLVSALRQATMRMDLCYESTEKLKNKLLHSEVREEISEAFIHHIPGCDVHGNEVALQVLDRGAWLRIPKEINKVLNINHATQKGFFKISMVPSVVGSSLNFGRMDPYLREFVIHETYFITGPDGCSLEALEVFSRMILEHIFTLHKLEGSPITGVHMGSTKTTRWSLVDVLNKKKAFVYDLEQHAKEKEPVFMKVYLHMDWRYVPIKKYFRLLFINADKPRHTMFYEENPADVYRSVFFDAAKAKFSYEQSTQQGGKNDPQTTSRIARALQYVDREIVEAKNRFDWLSIYRALLVRSLMNKGSSLIPEAWRMFNSVGSQVEYLISLAKSLQDLIKYVLEKEKLTTDQLPNRDLEDPESNDIKVHYVEAVLSQMSMAFRQKMTDVLQMKVTQASTTLGKYAINRLKSVTERDEVTRETFLYINLETCEVLEEIVQLLQCLQDALTYDVHCINPESQALLHSVEVEYMSGEDARPLSVDSYVLEEPDRFLNVPKAVVNDGYDYWGD